MNGDIDSQARLDRAARALHAEAVARVSPHTLSRLRPRAQPEPARRGWLARPVGWSLATACAAVFVFAVGMRTLAPPGAVDAEPPAQAVAMAVQPELDLYNDPLMALEEDPDLFLWLASEARPLAME